MELNFIYDLHLNEMRLSNFKNGRIPLQKRSHGMNWFSPILQLYYLLIFLYDGLPRTDKCKLLNTEINTTI